EQQRRAAAEHQEVLIDDVVLVAPLPIDAELEALERPILEEARRTESRVSDVILGVRLVDEARLQQVRAGAPALGIREHDVAGVETLRRIEVQLAVGAFVEPYGGGRH